MRGVPGGAVLLAGAKGGGVMAARVALFDIDGTLFDSERLWAEAGQPDVCGTVAVRRL